MATPATSQNDQPLRADMEEWDEFLQGRYREGKSQEEFRQYDEKADPGVARFYRLNPVSYTHLDVYKRQRSFQTPALAPIVVCPPKFQIVPKAYGCLLYTSSASRKTVCSSMKSR